MDALLARRISNLKSLDELAEFEKNAKRLDALTDEIKSAVDIRTAELGRELIFKKTKIAVDDLTPAEEKIIQAVATYVGIKRRMGRNANRTFLQLENRGLLEAAEISVAKARPTEGFETLRAESLSDLSYEQIILDHPEEFSDRAIWYARRTLGLPNASDKPPAKGTTQVQRRTEALISWIRDRSVANAGHIAPYTNAEAAAAIGLADLHQYGRVHGNIQSRLDFACYKSMLPPLGLTADAPFDHAWETQDRPWSFPIPLMKKAAQSRLWSDDDFDQILAYTRTLPGQAYISWKAELVERGEAVRSWANGETWVASGKPRTTEKLGIERTSTGLAATDPHEKKAFRVIAGLLGVELEEMKNVPLHDASLHKTLAAMESRFADSSPELKARVVLSVERGPIGAAVKKINQYRCQLCEAMGLDPISFRKRDGTPYVEAHHVMQVSNGVRGVLSSSNIMTLCANHHRQMHYGNAVVTTNGSSFEVCVDGGSFTIRKVGLTSHTS